MESPIPQSVAFGPSAFIWQAGQRARVVSLRYNGTEWVAETDPRNNDIEAAMVRAAKESVYGNPGLDDIQSQLDRPTR